MTDVNEVITKQEKRIGYAGEEGCCYSRLENSDWAVIKKHIEYLEKGIEKGINATGDLIANSKGVYGLGHNEITSTWEEILKEEKIEEWIINFDKTREKY